MLAIQLILCCLLFTGWWRLPYADISKGEHTHTDGFIFSGAAIYLCLKEARGAEEAYAVREAAAVKNTAAMGEKLAKLMQLPGCPDYFVCMWDPLSRKLFGANCGFRNVFYPRKKRRVPHGHYRLPL